ncbi:Phosphoadenylyl-sulfate reductase [Fulvivirga imtechensis AK7]|uniref:Phosphoadenylyl-sulfate reductase n=1 Tax=Fulvivirga imtechensis AK7 TaxID=1237149 RepID=L8JS77_9BACT|nr:phosphoadenosine phosphosulfate reductase family protein [Fulvivirga imtechensis]ELR71710.1 Phosphoadenylyl-sulfate reductase [Fulvivirga imtechensis AK7]
MKKTKVRHVLGISGGKDSAALALYLKTRHPELDVDYYTCDTGRELQETYDLIDRLDITLGKPIERLVAVRPKIDTPHESTFDHFLEKFGGFLPSSTARWCTQSLKLKPFEEHIGDEPTISYVGIRGDEDREGYISKKPNVQSIFPFRRNIWDEGLTLEVLSNKSREKFNDCYGEIASQKKLKAAQYYLETPISMKFTSKQKLSALLEVSVKTFNHAVFTYIKRYEDPNTREIRPVGLLKSFPLVENEDVLKLDDIFQILEDSGVGIPAYYKERTYLVEIDGEIKQGTYSRSRSGCFFCFYQQKIEWVWLYENHRELFEKAKEYEKDGYKWMDNETLDQLSSPDRIEAIKKEHYLRMQRGINKRNNQSWKEEIMEAEGIGCASCFI